MARTPSSMCPSAEELELFAVDARGLSQAKVSRDPLQSHLLECPRCQDRLERIRKNNARLRAFVPAGASNLDDMLAPRSDQLTERSRAGQSSRHDGSASLPIDSFTGYTVLREVHRGGQGVVFEAVQKSTNRRVALKVMREGPFAGPQDKARFDREVQVLGQLQHPNIVAIHDSGASAGHFFFVMDFIAGQALDEWMSGDRPIAEAIALFATLCEAVHAAHVRGIAHRDLKPSNVRVDMEGRPHVLDFGLAKVAGPFAAANAADSPAVTATGQFLGSLPWASPEQAEGLPSKIDVRTDVYSLGVILFQLLTGRFPYDVVGPMRDVLDHIIRSEPTRPRSISRRINDELETIALKCLHKERDRRYQTAGELARDLRRYLADEPIEAKRDSMTYVLRKKVRRHKLAVIATSCVVALLIVFSIAMTLAAQRNARLAERESAAKSDALAAQARAEWQAYMADIVAASSALAAHDVRTARQRLDHAPPQHRAWEWGYLGQASDQSVATLSGHTMGVASGVITPDGRHVITASTDRSIRLWDLESNQFVGHVGHHGSAFWTLALSPDGRHVAADCDDRKIRIWEVATGTKLATLPGLTQRATAVDYDTNGDRIAACAKNGVIRVWNSKTGEPMLVIRDGVGVAIDLIFSPDGRLLAMGNGAGDLRIFDATTGTVSKSIHAHNKEISRVAFSPDGGRIATSSFDGTAKVWDGQTGDCVITLRGSTARLIPVMFSHDGKRIATGGCDCTVRLWDAFTGDELATFIGHEQKVLWVRFSPDDAHLVSGSMDGTIKRWNLGASSGAMLALPAKHWAVALSPDGRTVAIGANAGAWLWHPDIASPPEPLANHPPGIHSVAFSPDGLTVAACATNGKVLLSDIRAPDGEPRILDAGRRAMGLSFKPDGTQLAVAADRQVLIWHLADGTVSRRLDTRGAAALCVAYSHDGNRLAVGVDDGSVRLWNAADGSETTVLRGHQNDVSAVAFSGDGRLIASASTDGTARIWDAATGATMHILIGHGRELQGLAFTPDGQRLATASWDTSVKIWSVATGDELLSLSGSSPFQSVSFSRDGTKLAAVDRDGGVRIWRSK